MDSQEPSQEPSQEQDVHQQARESLLLTYAIDELNELTEKQLQAIQVQLEENPADKQFADDMKSLAATLITVFQKERNAVNLKDIQGKDRVSTLKLAQDKLNEPGKQTISNATKDKRRPRVAYSIYGLAAMVLLGVCAIILSISNEMRQRLKPEYAPAISASEFVQHYVGGGGSVEGGGGGGYAIGGGSATNGSYAINNDFYTSSTTAHQIPDSLSQNLAPMPSQGFGNESYDQLGENKLRAVASQPLSTFSIDVDTASYANVRRMLKQGSLPPINAVRIEEMINYFDYDDAPPSQENRHPFSVHLEVNQSPWHTDRKLVRIGLKGKVIPSWARPPANLVFLLDVSGSMDAPNKLPLVKQSMHMLLNEMNRKDRVAIVVYASESGVVLNSTPADQKQTILAALDRLRASGSTNGGQGIEQAYQIAREQFIPDGINRVLLATDGDFNVGTTSRKDLVELIKRNRDGNIYLSILGYGMGNLKDGTMEALSNHGNGNYAYIDSHQEARKALVEQVNGKLQTIAKDVKIQVEFNPKKVSHYRLIGYENRMLKKEDFNNDRIDAGEIGAGHHVTALYEIIPVGAQPPVDPLRYQPSEIQKQISSHPGDELLLVKLRYKLPSSDQSTKIAFPLKDENARLNSASRDFKFAAAVATFGMILRESPHLGKGNFDTIRNLSEEAIGPDPSGHRHEFLELVRLAKRQRHWHLK